MQTFRPIFFLAFLALAGCEYAPLAVDENRPLLSDSVVSADVILHGESTFDYSARTGAGVDCTLRHDIQGWVGAPAVTRRCTSCTEVYTVFRETNDDRSDCPDDEDFVVPQTHSLGWDIVDNVRDDSFGSSQADDSVVDSQEWLAEQGELAGILRTTWTVFGYTDDPVWQPRFVLEEVAEEDWPEPPEDVEVTAVYSARDRFRWVTSASQSVSWTMVLQFSD